MTCKRTGSADQSGAVAQAIDGSAKVIVAAINQILHDRAGQG
jgi:hypothetical protein